MIKMDQSEKKFFQMCRYKEIDGKILVCFINDHVNSEGAGGRPCEEARLLQRAS